MDDIFLNCVNCSSKITIDVDSIRARYFCSSDQCTLRKPLKHQLDSCFVFYTEHGEIKWLTSFIKEIELGILINGWLKHTLIHNENEAVLQIDTVVKFPTSKQEAI